MQPTHVLSACYRFISDLSDVVPHINVVLGNHDLAYRRDYSTTALDALGMRRLSPFVSLHSGIERHVWDGRRVLLLPFREEQDELTAAVDALDPAEAKETVAFAHLAINKAILQRHIPQQQDNAASVDPLRGSVIYLGAPLQMNWADLNDEQRGVVLLDPSTLACEMLVNPHAIAYTTVDMRDVLGGTADVAAMAEKHVMILGELTRYKYTTARDHLLSIGARSVRNWNPMGPVVQEHNRASGGLGSSIPASDAAIQEPEQPAEDSVVGDTKSGVSVTPQFEMGQSSRPLDLGAEAQDYINSVSLDSSLEPRRKELVQAGQRVIHASSSITNEDVEVQVDYRNLVGEKPTVSNLPNSDSLTRPTADVFVAEPQSLVIRNFLGVQGVLTINFQRDLPRGLVFLVGDNGSGKSTIVEAMVWCQFGRCIRSGLGAGDVVNDTAGKDCSVSLTFSNGYTISRYRKDKTYKNRVIVSLHGEPQTNMEHPDVRTTQAAIEELLGIDCDTYVRSVVLGHESAASFLNSTPAQRRDVIEQSLGLSTLARCAQMSRAVLRDLDRQMGDVQTKLTGVANVVDSAKRELRSLERSQENLASEAGRIAEALGIAMQRQTWTLKQAQEETGTEFPTLAEYVAEMDGRVAVAGQHVQHMFKEASRAEVCIAFHAEMSSSLSRLSSAQERLEQLQALHNRLASQKAARPVPWWEKSRQRCIQKLEALSTTRLDGLPKITASATILSLRFQLSALEVWADIVVFFQGDKSDDLESTIAAVGANAEHAAKRVSQLHSQADATAVAEKVAGQRRVDREEVEQAASAISLDTARTTNQALDQASKKHEELRRQREGLLAQVREQEQLQQKLGAKKREVGIYQKLAEEKRTSITLQLEQRELATELAQLASTRELFAFWASAFAKRTRRISTADSSKSITTFREYVLDQSLAELNTLLPQVLTVLYDDTRHAKAMTTGILGSLFERDDGG
ncbi:hypothetical protein MAPG_11496, partial [Magnaporthiopsis poae ATCC 64411]